MTVKVLAPAKINLALHITGQRDDGYHQIDSLVAFGPAYDVVGVTAAAQNTLSISGPEAAGLPADDDNLILRAARLLDVGAAHFALEKNLPIASGIGGGSSDAAAALRGLLVVYDESHDLHDGPDAPLREFGLKLLGLGADIPMCLLPRSLRVGGIGEKLVPQALPPVACVLVNPRVQVATAKVFSALHSKQNPAMPARVPQFEDSGQLIDWLADQRNDLQAPARALVPEIDHVLEVLGHSQGCGLARMSGSGATCFGLFADPDRAKAASYEIAAARPDWWVAGGMLGERRDWASALA